MNNFKFWYNVMRCLIVLIFFLILVIYPEVLILVKYFLNKLIK